MSAGSNNALIGRITPLWIKRCPSDKENAVDAFFGVNNIADVPQFASSFYGNPLLDAEPTNVLGVMDGFDAGTDWFKLLSTTLNFGESDTINQGGYVGGEDFNWVIVSQTERTVDFNLQIDGRYRDRPGAPGVALADPAQRALRIARQKKEVLLYANIMGRDPGPVVAPAPVVASPLVYFGSMVLTGMPRTMNPDDPAEFAITATIQEEYHGYARPPLT